MPSRSHRLKRKNLADILENEGTDAYSGTLGYNVKKIKEDVRVASGINRRDFLKASARAGLLLVFSAGR
jgi:hypothetical protein